MSRDRITRMDAGTAAQWGDVFEASRAWQAGIAGRMIELLRRSDQVDQRFGVSQLQHMLQTATRARRANASDEMVFVSLLHDAGKAISIANHDRVAAEILKPYVSEAAYHVVRTHQDFQSAYFGPHHPAGPVNLAAYEREPWFRQAQIFSAEWDQVAFDPKYDSLPLEEFEPLLRQFFGRPPF